jgi:glyoxylase-like metal-dependent hydrolase (beta-lactamase superfamily II)
MPREHRRPRVTLVLEAGHIERLHLGHYTVPEEMPGRTERHPLAGKQIVVTGFLIRHPRGIFVFDTGFGQMTSELTTLYRTVRRDVVDALARTGVAPKDIAAIANCHLHFDHGGGNHRFPGTTILAQKVELELARGPDHTIPADVCDFPRARFEEIEGDADPLPGLRIIPTPGHTKGHQSLVVETKQGRVILAGQSQNLASDHAIDAFARELALRGEPHAAYPSWMDRFAELDPWRVLFAHDLAIWERPPAA